MKATIYYRNGDSITLPVRNLAHWEQLKSNDADMDGATLWDCNGHEFDSYYC